MRKPSLRAAVLVALVASLVGSPAFAASDDRADRHGPMPLALPLVVLSTTVWAASLVPCALIAPTHIMDSFDDMVARPWNVMIGRESL